MTRPPHDNSMPLGDHLEELRRRLILALMGLLPIAIVAFIYGDRLLALILSPVRTALHKAGQSDLLQATNALETFSSYMKVSLIAAIIVGSPWVLYQLWRFVAPGLYIHERRFVYFLLPLSAVMTTLGVFFLFRVIIPIVLAFLVTFGADLGAERPAVKDPPQGTFFAAAPILEADPPSPKPGQFWINKPMMRLRVCVAEEGGEPVIFSTELHKTTGVMQQYRVSETVSLLLSLTLAFAGAFQAPIVVLLLGWAGLIDQAFLKKYRRHAILICAIASAAITPGDPTSMVAMLIPLYGLYEFGGLLLRWFPAARVAGKREGDDEEPASDAG